jgi:holo-[acyl-carrier protein] synthase
MIKGIGIDICDIKRFKKAIKNNSKFLARIFSAGEIAYCRGKKNSVLHYAGRFAVKEAFIKAVSTDKSVPLNEIEVINDRFGKPEIALTPRIRAMLKAKRGKKFSLSISHTHDAAAAVCVIT